MAWCRPGKALLDGLTECGVIVDDNVNVIGQPNYKWEMAGRGSGFVTVRIEDLGNQK